MSANYKKIQFISWELNTGPFVSGTINRKTLGFYAGVRVSATDDRTDALSQCLDVDARVAFTADALEKAYKLADRSADTLKVFMGPEFLYRGAGGAYLHDLINGWVAEAPAELHLPPPYSGKWGGLFGGLQALAADERFGDWLFVFGSAISASFKPYQASDGKYYLDPSAPGEIYNTALVQRGSAAGANDNYASRKQYISGIDFLDWYVDVPAHRAGTVLPLDPRAVVPIDAMGVCEGGAVFSIDNVNDSSGAKLKFGIEICLDHALSNNDTNHWGRIRTADQYVKVQLVPSGGMTLMDASIRLLPAGAATPNSYAFNCDGLGDLAQAYGCHTQVWNGSNGAVVPLVNKLYEASNGAALAHTNVAPVVSNVMIHGATVNAAALWNNGMNQHGSGSVRVMPVLAL